MPTPEEMVTSAIAYFFDTALPQATGKQFADLPSPSVHVGAYSAWDGTALTTTAGQPVTPAYALRVSPALPVAAGKPNPAGVAAPTTGPARHLLYVRNVADAAVDDAAEIQRVMADLDSFVALFGDGGGGTAGVPATDASVAAARAAEWATAIVASRASLGVNLSTLTAVPAALAPVAPDLPALKEVLQHFFTYTPDGTYYPRWAGAGRDAANPAHLTPLYKQHNVLEQQLERDQLYLYAVLPEPLLAGGGDLGGGVFREVVIRFQPTGVPTAPFSLAAIHTVRMRPAAAPFCDFVFFYAAAGSGIPLPRTTMDKLSAGLVSLVAALAAPDPSAKVSTTSEIVSVRDDGTEQVHLVATLQGEPTLPPGVICGSDGPVRIMLTPLDQVAAVAALPQVTNLGLLAPSRLNNDQARGMANLPTLDAKMPVGKKGGQGVLIGVIDSGIDGSHPSFTGRLHAVWDQGRPTAVAGTSPAAHHPVGDPLNLAYRDFNFGVELTGVATQTSLDINYVNTAATIPPVPPADGHGTHVSATAAGAEVRDGAGNVTVPAGVAPLARLAVVRSIQAGARNGDEVLGARWIFQKATELGVPCVINMSFGHHSHGHDGSDDNAAALHNAMVDATGNYRPGRIVVASAGNERQANMHVRRQVPPMTATPRTTAVVEVVPAFVQVVDVYVRDPTGTKPAAFPLSIYVFRKTARRNTFKDVTRKIAIGTNATAPNAAGVFNNHKTSVEITSVRSDLVTGDHRFRIVFRTTDPVTPVAMIGNQWGIVVVNETAAPLDVHMWIPGGSASFADATGDDDHAFLVGQPAASSAAISVASAISRLTFTDITGQQGPPLGNEQTRLKELSTFSSPGPLRASSIPPASFDHVTHEVNGVDITGPGGFTHSAMSSQVATAAWLAIPSNREWVINNQSRIMTGTSMASPVITGLVATILADEPTLTMPQVLARLKAAATIPPESDFQPPVGGGAKPLSPDWGYGLVDAGKLRP